MIDKPSRLPSSASDDRAASDVPDRVLDPATALRLANRAALRSLCKNPAARYAGGAVDIAADALALLLEKKIPLYRRSIVATVKNLTRYSARLAASASASPLESLSEEEGALAARDVDASEQSARPLPRPHCRTFADGSVARLDGVWCEADIADLTLTRPDGSVRRGREALVVAHQLLLQERSHDAGAWQAVNTRRATEALARDALLLSVAGLPWQEALARLAEQGVRLSRDGLRSGQRAARRRCMGLSAHDAARESSPALVRGLSHRRHSKSGGSLELVTDSQPRERQGQPVSKENFENAHSRIGIQR